MTTAEPGRPCVNVFPNHSGMPPSPPSSAMTQPRSAALHNFSLISLTTCPTALRVLRCKSRGTKKASLRFPSFRSNLLWYIRHLFFFFYTNAWVGLRRTTVDQAHIMWNGTKKKRNGHGILKREKKDCFSFGLSVVLNFIPENFGILGIFTSTVY